MILAQSMFFKTFQLSKIPLWGLVFKYIAGTPEKIRNRIQKYICCKEKVKKVLREICCTHANKAAVQLNAQIYACNFHFKISKTGKQQEINSTLQQNCCPSYNLNCKTEKAWNPKSRNMWISAHCLRATYKYFHFNRSKQYFEVWFAFIWSLNCRFLYGFKAILNLLGKKHTF